MLADNRLSLLSRTTDSKQSLESSPAPTLADALLNERRDLRSQVALLYKRKWMILSIVTVVTALVAVYMYNLPSVYEAETTIRIEQKNESFLRSKDIVINTASDPVYWNTQLKLLENPTLMRRVILALDLHHNPSFFNARQQTGIVSSFFRMFRRDRSAPVQNTQTPAVLAVAPNAEELTPEQRAELAPYVNVLHANLVIEPVTGTNLIKIRFRHTDPEISMKVTDTLAEIFIHDDFKRENEGMENASAQLSMQIADLQMTIKQQEEQRINYIKNHGLPLGEIKGENLTSVRLDTLSSQLLAAENDRKNLQAAYELAARARENASIPEVQENKGVQEIKEKLRGLEQRRAALLVRYTSQWPEVKQVEQEIAQLKSEMERASRDVVTGMKSRYEAALGREEKLRQSYFGERETANRQSQSEIELNSLNQQIETNKQLSSTLFQRQKELELNASDRKSNVSVATPSEKPLAPVGPARSRNVMVAFFVSLIASIGLTFLLQQLDDSIKSVDELVTYTSLPNLALIPSMRRTQLERRADIAELPEGRAQHALPELLENARSPVAEAFRHLRTSLLFSSGARPPRSILVTSGQALEGKTTVAFNTAIALAQTGASVVLVDCDLRRPSIQKYINVKSEPGLTDYLAGELTVDEALKTYSELPNLKVMTSGYLPLNPAELLGSDEMLAFINLMKERFNYVVIDSPPAISFADGAIISTLVDGVIIVVHGGKSSRAVVRHIIHRLTGVGARICGTVLNNVKPEPYDYYYNSYYYNYHAKESASPQLILKKRAEPEPEPPQPAPAGFSTGQLEQEFEKFQRSIRGS